MADNKNTETETKGTDDKTPENNIPDSGKDEDKADDTTEGLESRLEAAENNAKESYDRLLRVSAEFDNYKKRSSREIDEFRKFANEALINKMLPVVDNIERALNSANNTKADAPGIVEGLEMTLDEILKVFEAFGVKRYESLNKEFNPNIHQAVIHEEAEDVKENIITKEFQKGYMIHNRLLRPAMVAVSKAKIKS